jgi:polysaccharide export outer membrane protein
VFALLIAGCGGAGGSTMPTDVASLSDDTSLGTGDVFEVRVFGEKDLSGSYQVGPDGSISFPFVGTVVVAGKEAAAVAQELAARLKQGGYLVDPQVSVFVQEANSKRISVIGAVAKPGTLSIIPGMTVVQAVSQAGGFAPLASKDDTVVTRRVNGALKKYRIPVSDITRGDADDFPLRAGDIVYVPERVF